MADECCPQLNKEDWDLKFHHWDKRAFYVKKHGLFLHMPIGIGKAIKQGMEEIKQKGYKWGEPYMILQEELGAFSARELFAIQGLPEDENVVIFEPRDLYSKYYHGSFAGIKKQINELLEKRFPCFHDISGNQGNK